MRLHCPRCSRQLKEETRHCIHCGFDLASMPGFFNSVILPKEYMLEKRYRIKEYITSGGMAHVYKVVDNRLKNTYALKEMMDNFRNAEDRILAVERFSREAEILAKLKHPAIPRVIDHFVENNRYYLVMDFIEGKDLESLLDKQPDSKFSQEKVLNWTEQILDVLIYLHKQEPPVIYRDLKPSNILLDSHDRIFLIDFGIARIFSAQKKGTLIGTPGYSPPEQYKGNVDIRSDIYALGATLHHLLTGRDPRNDVPFNFPPVEELVEGVEPGLIRIIEKCLQYDMENRFKNVAELKQAVEIISKRDQIEKLYQEGLDHLKKGDFTGAVPLLSQALKYNPRDSRVLINRGVAYEKLGKTEEAVKDFQSALDIEPDNPDIHYNLACAFKNKGDLEEAKNSFNMVLNINPSHSSTYNNLGNIFFMEEDWDKAIEMYEKALEIQPDFQLAKENIEKAQDKKDRMQRVERYNQTTGDLTDPSRAYFNLGMYMMGWDRLEEAESEFKKAMRVSPGDADVYWGMGKLYIKKGDPQKAETFLKKAVELSPLSARYYLELGKLYLDTNRLPDAVNCYREGIKRITRSDSQKGQTLEFQNLEEQLNSMGTREKAKSGDKKIKEKTKPIAFGESKEEKTKPSLPKKEGKEGKERKNIKDLILGLLKKKI